MTKGEIPRKLLLAVSNASQSGGLSFSEDSASGLKPFVDWYKSQDKYGRYRIRKTFGGLRAKGFIDMTQDENGQTRVLLTDMGYREVLKHQIDYLKLIPLPAWDGKWRIIISNSSETKIKSALNIRFKRLGLHRVQTNIWIYPHACKEEVKTITEALNAMHFIKYIEADLLEGDQEFKNIFGLS